MVKMNDLTAEEMMEEDPVTVASDRSLTQVKNRMEEEDIRAVPVVSDGDTLEGVIGYRDLIRHIQFSTSDTGLSKVMHQPPGFDPEDFLVDICDLRINSGRKLLVHEKGGKLQGVIGDRQFLHAFKDVEEVSKLDISDISTDDLYTVFEQDSLEVARHRMLDNNLSRLPVKNDKGSLTGIVSSTDMLSAMVPHESQESGGSKGNRSGNEVFISGGTEKRSMGEVTVNQIMDRMVTTTDEELTGSEAIQMMIEQDSTEIIRVEDKTPESIVTVKDFITYVDSIAPSDTVLVQLIGVDVEEEKTALHEKIRNQLRGSLGRKLNEPEELTLHVKKTEKGGKRHRYEMIMRLHCEYGRIAVNEEGWDMLDVMDEALEELNSQVRTEKEKKDHRKKK